MPFAELPGARIYYETHGDGPWLVFAHGAGGNCLSWWQQIPHFAARYRCLVYEQPGWGRSTADGAPDPARFADDLVALLDHLGVARTALVGQSMGGWAVLGCALRIPARITHVLLASTLGGLTDEATTEMLLRVVVASTGQPIDAHAALAADYPAREPVKTHLFEQIAGMNPPLQAAFLQALVRLRLEPPRDAPFKLGFIAGDRDRLFPLPMIQQSHARVPGAELTVVPGSGHSIYFEYPDAFNRTLDEFLRR
jgi:pimeloyl-ACP methyl ester carboxylesterase